MSKMTQVCLEAGTGRSLAERLRGLNRWWTQWQRHSTNRRVFGAMLTVGVWSVVVKLMSMIKEGVVAYRFGTGDELDAFLMAYLIPQFGISLIGGSLNAALIPTYIEVRERMGRDEAQRILSTVTVVTICVLTFLSALLAWYAPKILTLIASGFTQSKLALTQSYYNWLLITVILTGISTTWGAVLNAANRFVLVAAVPLVTPLLTVLAVVMGPARWGGHALAIGAVAGALLEAVALGWALTREGVSVWPRWGGDSPQVRQVIAQYVPMVAGAFVMGSTGVVSQSMAAMLGPGSVAALGYGTKVTNLLVGIGAVAVSTAVLPFFSHMVAKAEWNGLCHTLFTYGKFLLVITLPPTLCAMYYSEPIVSLLFERGAFSSSDTGLVAKIQAMCLLQVPSYIVCMLMVRVISALKANYVLMWGAVINLAMNVILTYVLMRSIGVIGIALASSVMYLISLSFLSFMSFRLIGEKARACG